MGRTFRLISVSSFLLFAVMPVFAGAVTFAEIEAELLANNPELAAGQALYRAGLERVAIENSLENPALEYEDTLYSRAKMLSVSQKFPFPGKRGLKSKAAQAEAEALRYDYEKLKIDLLREAKNAWAELYRINRSIEITGEQKIVLDQIAGVMEIKYATGQVNQADLLRVQLEIANLADSLLLLKEEKSRMEIDLNRLLNRTPQNNPFPDIELSINLDRNLELNELYERARTGNPKIKLAEQELEKTKTLLALAQKDYYPDLMAKIGYMDTPGMEDREDWRFSIMLDLPFWRKKLSAGVRSAEQEVAGMTKNKEAMTNEVLRDVGNAFLCFQTSRRRVILYRDGLLPQAGQAFKASQINYQTAKIDSLSLLDSQRSLLEKRLKYEAVFAKTAAAEAELEAAVGTDLESMGVKR
ncbi:MAG: TolC family protein [Candidatus Omnitrophota bacterium]